LPGEWRDLISGSRRSLFREDRAVPSYSSVGFKNRPLAAREVDMNYGYEGARYGVSFGTALAIVISYTNNHSILWALIHGFLSWFYVIYYAIVY
jgi:hypothetical protein